MRFVGIAALAAVCSARGARRYAGDGRHRGSRIWPHRGRARRTSSSATASSSASTAPATRSTTSPFTKQSLQAMLERLGVNIRGANLRTGNVAAVMVTANLPAFGTQGTRIDVTVSALGDAKSLQGGTLLVTPLLGADGEVYAVGAGLGRHRRLPGRGRRRQDHPRRADRRPHRQRRHRRARDRLRAQPAEPRCAWRCATPTSPPPSASPPRSTISSAPTPPSRSIPSTVQINVPQHYHRQRGRAAHRDRAAAGRARPAAKIVDRRALRHHRHGPRRARLHGRGRAGQPHRHHHRDAAGQPAGTALATARPRVVPRTSIGVDRRTARSSPWSRRACRCSNWSTASTRSASARAT